MRYGHGPAGIVGSTMHESTLAIWALSQSTCAQLMNDLEAMKDGEEQYVLTSHKEERHTRIKLMLQIERKYMKQYQHALMCLKVISIQ